jgi:hypothetical protein
MRQRNSGNLSKYKIIFNIMGDKNENFNDDFVVNLKNDRGELRENLENKKENIFSVRRIGEFFSFSFKKERGVNFIKDWEEFDKIKKQEVKKDKVKTEKTRRSFNFFKKVKKLKPNLSLPSLPEIKNPFILRTYNTCQRNFFEIIWFFVKIVFVNIKIFIASLFNLKNFYFRIIKSVKSILSLFFSLFLLPLKFFKLFRFKKRGKKKEKEEKKESVIKIKEKKRKKEKVHGDKEAESFLLKFYHSPKFILKSLFSFVFLLFLLIIPFKVFSFYNSLNLSKIEGRVLDISEKAVSNLKQASYAFTELDMEGAEINFSEASNNFAEAKEELEEINGIIFKLSRFAPQDKIKLASISKQVMDMGSLASQIGGDLSLAIDSLFKIDFKNESKSIIKRIEESEVNIKKASEKSTLLNIQLNKIDYQVLPAEYQEQFVLLREKSNNLETFLANLESLVVKLKVFLGEEQDKKYLLVFQNTGEARATGGFVGSFALAEFSQGRLKNIEIPKGGSYDVDGSLNRLIPAPEPLQLVTDRWYFRDSNWWPDWPTSAEKLMWFYEASGGPTVDGCISFTPEVLASVLDITGPLDMTEDYGIIITKENFWDNIRKSIEEEKKLDDNKPKKIINDLFEKIIEKLPGSLDQEKLTNFLISTRDNLKSKDILFYFKDSLLQEEVEKRSWGGRIKDTNNDYLSVINTNIAGGKSDRQIEQEINHQVEILDDGTVIDTLKIVRKHTGASSQYFYGNRNVNWIRVYVPLGSRLIEASGFEKPSEIYFEHPPANWEKDELIKQEENYARVDPDSDTRIYQENNKTVFANWSMAFASVRCEIPMANTLSLMTNSSPPSIAPS